MVRPPCYIEEYRKEEGTVKKGAWTAEEDEKLVAFIKKNQGHGSWRTLPKLAGLERCGKSCRLRWTNYLRPNIKRGNFSTDEERIIVHLHAMLGNKWSNIASHLPGRTDNEVKNHWNTHLKKRLTRIGIDPATHLPFNLLQASHQLHNNPSTCMRDIDGDWQKALLQHSLHVNSTIACHLVQWELARLEAEARQHIPSSHGPYIHNYCTQRLQNLHQSPSPACNLSAPVGVANAQTQTLYSQSLSNVLSSQLDNSQTSNDKHTGNDMLSPSQVNGMSPGSTSPQLLEHSPLSNEEAERLQEDCVLTSASGGSTGTLDTCSSSNSLSSHMLCSQFDVPDDLLSFDLSSDESYNPVCLGDPCKSSIVAFDNVLPTGRQESYWNRVLNFLDQAALEKL